MLRSVLASLNTFSKSLPPVVASNQKLKAALLKSNPLWADILYFRSMRVTIAGIARVCGCHPGTVRRNIKKMEAAGLFDDPRCR
jgi:DNA-binding MarR family transcriptional regulator